MAMITAPHILDRILTHFSLPTHPPPVAPARQDPQSELGLDEHPPDEAYLDEPPDEHGLLACSRAPPNAERTVSPSPMTRSAPPDAAAGLGPHAPPRMFPTGIPDWTQLPAGARDSSVLTWRSQALVDTTSPHIRKHPPLDTFSPARKYLLTRPKTRSSVLRVSVCARDVRRRPRSDRPLRRPRGRRLRPHRWGGNSQSPSIAAPSARRPEPNSEPQLLSLPRERLQRRPPEAFTRLRRTPRCALRALVQPHATCSRTPCRPKHAA